MQLIFATRQSNLAQWQTQWVMNALQSVHPGLICEKKTITTRGDRILNKPLPEISGKGLFTQELESELLSGHLQVAVHSLKDLPVESTPGLTIGAIPARGEFRDVFISPGGYSLETLPSASRVGTSSLRRAAQILALRPDLKITPLRGNVDTRLRKVLDSQYDAIILAGAGLVRLGLTKHISQWFPLEMILPAPGQGALAVQCRADDKATLSLLAAIDDPVTRAAVTAERQFLFHLGGGCAVPVGAFSQQIADGEPTYRLDGLVASVDGRRVIRVSDTGINPFTLGETLAQSASNEGPPEILKGDIHARQQ
jgi:hydroxymethylbilane synthase